MQFFAKQIIHKSTKYSEENSERTTYNFLISFFPLSLEELNESKDMMYQQL